MAQLYLPVLSHFKNGNVWSASDNRLRYLITPQDETLVAEAWEGPWSYEFSRVEEKKAFPLEEAGLLALSAWITEWSDKMNARPPKTLADTIRLRDEVAAERRDDKG